MTPEDALDAIGRLWRAHEAGAFSIADFCALARIVQAGTVRT